MNELKKYIRSIRNSEKRRYAEHYSRCLITQAQPRPQDYSLGAMGKQAVEIRVNEILNIKGERNGIFYS